MLDAEKSLPGPLSPYSREDVVLAQLAGQSIHLSDILQSPVLKSKLRHLIEELATRRLMVEAAAAAGLQIDDADLEAELRQLMKDHQLGETDLAGWLKSMQLTQQDLLTEIRWKALSRRWEAHLDARIEPYYQQHRGEFDEVLLSHLVVREEGVARELLVALYERDETFEDLVRRYAVATIETLSGARRERRSDRGLMGSYIGPVRRGQMRAEIETKVFAARAGEVVGPFRLRDGWELIKVLEVRSAQLTPKVREEIHRMFYEEWLHTARTQSTLDFCDGLE